jgi:universal stress protein E
MGTQGRILAIVDPTAEAQPAVERAAWLARHLGCGLELFICHHDPYLAGERFFDSPDLQAARDTVMQTMRQRVDELARPLADAGLDVVPTRPGTPRCTRASCARRCARVRD